MSTARVIARIASAKWLIIKLSLITLLLFPAANITASGITSEDAGEFARQFLSDRKSEKKTDQEVSLTEVYRSTGNVRNKLYGFQDHYAGFVLVAEYDGEFIVTAWSHDGIFDASNIDLGLGILLHQYEHALSFDVSDKSRRQAKSAGDRVSPLLQMEQIKWGQRGIFNTYCPYDYDAAANTVAGCVAVSMGQTMRFHKYPQSGTGSHSYEHHKYGIISADFENTVYRWDDMPGDPADANDFIAELLFHCGVASEMNYGVNQSGAYLSNAEYALRNHFGYHNVLQIAHSDFSGNMEIFYQIIRNEIAENRPVIYILQGDPGHAVVADGYDDDYFHLNFGWQGYCDGYYLLEGITLVDNYDFYMTGNAIVGISPFPIVTNEQDSLALVDLYNSTNGDQWLRRNGWMTDLPLNQWQGVNMVNGRVFKLELAKNKLSGKIPASLGNLSSLLILNLSNNALDSLPPEIGDLTNLISLEIRVASLAGEIPPEIGNLKRLQKLDLTANKLTGEIPDAIYELKNLNHLSLGNNNLSGEISPLIGQLDALRYFSVWKNQLEGRLPDETGNLIQLRELIITENQFSGTIPETIGSWTNLYSLNIAKNQFEGALPDAILNFSNLTNLKIESNQFTSLPDSIGRLTKLRTIEANYNLIEALPSSISNLENLSRLELYGNQISELPYLGEMPSLTYLQLSNNQIEKIPESFGDLSRISTLYLGNNKISELPSSFENLTTLRRLILLGNRLENVPVSICFLGNLEELYLNHNELSQPLPPLNHLQLKYLDLRRNKLVYSDIAASQMPDDLQSNSSYNFDYYDQARVELTDSVFKFAEGDSAGIDIRSITRLSHPENEYEWFSDNQLIQTGPILSFTSFSKEDEGTYLCKIINPRYRKVLVLETHPLTVTIASDELRDGFLITSRASEKKEFTDNQVLLIPPPDIRGELTWQASVDSLNWFDISDDTGHEAIKSVIVSIDENNILTEPKTDMLFRYMITEDACDPVFSDTIRLYSYGDLLVDTLINTVNNQVTISVDSIEIIIPADFTEGDFRLTVKKLNSPPPSPDSVTAGTVYDVNVSIGNIFDLPLIIRLKNLDTSSFTPESIDEYTAVYFDEKSREWVRYPNARFSMKDSTLVFETDHLTKLSWWKDKEAMWGYTDVFVRNNIRVFYKEGDYDRFDFIYGKKQTQQPWHADASDPDHETPYMIQDIAHFLYEVMENFRGRDFKVPDHAFSVYVKEMDDYGSVGIMGMLNHYLNISRDIESPLELRSLLAHEYMHYTQDSYISAHAGNIFWMEAHAHLADRMVWDETIIPVSESELYLLNGRSDNNTIFEFLSTSWDYWDKSILTQNARGNIYYCYLAGTFLHYMRSYKEGEKLDPVILLKETPYFQSWLNYLDNYIQKYLGSNIGDQYEDFVKYIIEGSNSNFGFLNKNEGADPLSFLRGAPSEFMSTKFLKFDNEPGFKRVSDSIRVDMPYLSSKMVQLYNLNNDNRKVLVRYKRNHDAHENNRVFLVRYDPETGNMTLGDISAVDSSYFLIDSPSDINMQNKNHIAYILFVNKDKSESFTIDYDLELIPIPEFSFLEGFGFIIGNNLTEAEIHTFTEGTETIISKFHMMPGVFRQFYGPLTYHSQISDSLLVTNATSEKIIQSVTYNFITGNMTIYNRENWGGTDPASTIDIREITIVLKNIWLNPYPAGTDLSFAFSTRSTEQTQNVIESIDYTREYARWNQEEGRHDPLIKTTYVNTNFATEDVKFHLSFY